MIDYNIGANPKIEADYLLTGSPLMSRPHFRTRDERRRDAEVNFYAALELELEEKVPATSGVIIIQQGHYPMDFDVAINPTLEHHCARPVIDTGAMLRQSYVFASHSYWLCQGQKRLEPLIGGVTVLSRFHCEKAVEKYIAFKGDNMTSSYLGVKFCTVKRKEYPYRVWKFYREGVVGYLFMSLLNGAVFEVKPQDLPEMKETPDVFKFGDVCFKHTVRGDYTRQ